MLAKESLTTSRRVVSTLVAIGLGIIVVEVGILLVQILELDLLGAVQRLFRQYRALTGLVWPVLLAMSVASGLAVLALLLEAAGMLARDVRRLCLGTLSYVTEASVVVGLLQTFVSLSGAQLSLDTSLEQARLLSLLTQATGRAYGSTIVGLGLALGCYTAQRIFAALKKDDR